jgi:O-antigen/teichoic acid export membrane protein
MMSMFENFSLPDLARVSRRTMLSALIIGVVGLAVCVLLRAPLTGLGLCIGLGLGIFNFRLIQRSVVRVGLSEEENRRRPLATNTMVRLGIITVIALGLLFLSFDLGLGVMAGLALFQLLLLGNVARSMFKMGHGGVGGMLDAAAVSFTLHDDDEGVA